MTGRSCPDWPRLLRERDLNEENPQGWAPARRHLQGCRRCRREALRLDPTLVFTLLGDVELPPEEGDDMVRRVQAARRGLAVKRDGSSHRWRWAAIAAGVLLPALLVLPNGPRRIGLPSPSDTALVTAAAAAPAALSAELALMPVLEVEEPFARTFHWSRDDVAVVLVVDERLDV
jgi:hypothetical protein